MSELSRRRVRNGKLYLFDILRKKYVVATPEEEVRQEVLHYLMQELKYPRGLITVESGLVYNKQRKRTDVVVYHNTGSPYMLIECKRREIRLGKEAVYQLAAYNKEVKAEVLVLTNALDMICLRIDSGENKLVPLPSIPPYQRERR